MGESFLDDSIPCQIKIFTIFSYVLMFSMDDSTDGKHTNSTETGSDNSKYKS